MIRKAAVAGYFYTDDAEELAAQVQDFMSEPAGEKRTAKGVIAPHAGLVYSGRVAGALYAATELPKRFLILCPQHRGGGALAAIQTTGYWETPLGRYPIDEELAAAITQRLPQIEEDPRPHKKEHAIEVQIPFLQIARPDGMFVPIALAYIGWEQIVAIAEGLVEVMSAMDDPPLVIASSDMNHYLPEAETLSRDERALEQVRALDARGLLDRCRSEDISMCGVVPATTLLCMAPSLGVQKAEVLQHTTSAETSGDPSRVVGYASIQLF